MERECSHCGKLIEPTLVGKVDGDWTEYEEYCPECGGFIGTMRLPRCLSCNAGVYPVNVGKFFVEVDAVVCRACLKKDREAVEVGAGYECV